MDNIGGIYKITNPKGEVYIGQTKNIRARWKRYGHRQMVPIETPVYLSIRTWGIDKHRFEVAAELPTDASQKTFDEYERLYINQYRDCGFTILNVRDGGKDGRLADSTKEKLSEKRKGKSSWSKGKTFSEEHRNKIRIANTGNVPTDETRNKLSASLKGRVAWNKGLKGAYKCSEETKKLVSEKMKVIRANQNKNGIHG